MFVLVAFGVPTLFAVVAFFLMRDIDRWLDVARDPDPDPADRVAGGSLNVDWHGNSFIGHVPEVRDAD